MANLLQRRKSLLGMYLMLHVRWRWLIDFDRGIGTDGSSSTQVGPIDKSLR